MAALRDDDPLWEQSSGGATHRGAEWGTGDEERAEDYSSALHAAAKLILDLLMDRPGERIDADWVVAQLNVSRPPDVPGWDRRSVAASLAATSAPHRASGRRQPFYWWDGSGDAPSLYAMKRNVASLFRDARHQASARQSGAAAGTDWTDAEVGAIVGDYLAMLANEIAGRPYQKAEHRRALHALLSPSRTDGAIEFKHQNISAAMADLGLPYIRGYKPLGNYQDALVAEIQRRLEESPGLLGSLRPQSGRAAVGATLEPGELPRRRPKTRQGTHLDYGLIHEENTRLGRLGEQFVVEYEQQRLLAAGRPDFARRVRWVANEDGDGLGYDVLSFTEGGSERHIEVKTTSYGADMPIYISAAELDFARRHPETYVLYRVYNVQDAPRFVALNSAQVIALEMVPVSYRARITPADQSD